MGEAEGGGLEKIAARGKPSYRWREGQERRLAMVRQWAPVECQRVLDVGCGVGMYTAELCCCGDQVVGIEVEMERAKEAALRGLAVVQAVGEALPFPEGVFNVVFNHEVMEHAQDDNKMAAEMVRVASPGGRLIIFCPNRWYPFETHGYFWQGNYRFGNTPLVNYLPDPLRNRLVPHVRAYSIRGLRALFRRLPARLVHHTQIYPGYDNIVANRPGLGRWLRRITYWMERTPLRILGLSHFIVLEREESSDPNAG